MASDICSRLQKRFIQVHSDPQGPDVLVSASNLHEYDTKASVLVPLVSVILPLLAEMEKC